MSMPVLKGLLSEKFHGGKFIVRLFRRWNDRIVEKVVESKDSERKSNRT